jgi:hypothetical protein
LPTRIDARPKILTEELKLKSVADNSVTFTFAEMSVQLLQYPTEWYWPGNVQLPVGQLKGIAKVPGLKMPVLIADCIAPPIDSRSAPSWKPPLLAYQLVRAIVASDPETTPTHG